jgi:amino acid permease
MKTKQLSEEQAIERVLIRVNATMIGITLGLLLGTGLFVATNWLVIRGGPLVGLHLGLLRQYFPGYSVSFVGSLVGFVYASLVGFGTGLLIGSVYNRLAR